MTRAPFSPLRARFFASMARAARDDIKNALLSRQRDPALALRLQHLAQAGDIPGLKEALGDPRARASAGLALSDELCRAAQGASSEGFESLLAAGARLDSIELNQDSDSPLMTASARGSESVALALAPHSDPNYRDRGNRSELARALLSHMPQLARALLAAGANPSAQDDYGMGCLEIAAFCGYPDIARELHSRGARLADPSGRSADALAACAFLGREESALFLADLGAGFNGSCSLYALSSAYSGPGREPPADPRRWDRFAPDFDGSVLHWAAFRALPRLLKRALNSGQAGSIDFPTRPNSLHERRKGDWANHFSSATPLALAIAGGSEECALELLRAGASPERAMRRIDERLGPLDPDCQSLSELAMIFYNRPLIHPLALATSVTQEQIDRLWLRWPSLDLDPLAPSHYNISQRGESLLSIACGMPDARSLASALIERGAAPERLKTERHNDGMDPLMQAANIGADPLIIPFLVGAGCDPLRRDENGMLALQHALLNPRHPEGSPAWPLMFEAVAMAMAALPGGLSVIQESLQDESFKNHCAPQGWGPFLEGFLPRLEAMEQARGLAAAIAPVKPDEPRGPRVRL